jgi:hypothetical protein
MVDETKLNQLIGKILEGSRRNKTPARASLAEIEGFLSLRAIRSRKIIHT